MSGGAVLPLAARIVIGTAFAAAGLFPILAAFDVGPLRSSDIHGPPWIGVAAGAVFVTGGVFVFLQDAAARRPWLGGALGFLIVAAFAAITNWIAFGSGPRVCSATFSFAIFTGSRWAAELECRIAFGLAGMMCNGLMILLAGRALLQAGVKSALPRYLDKIGAGLLLLGLGPLLLAVIAVKLVEQGMRWCWQRITGRSPQA